MKGGIIMRSSNIIYKNLRAEMGREQLTIGSLAAGIDMNRDTLSRKLSNSSPIYLDEAFLIKEIFFTDKSLEYLFKELMETQPHHT